MSRATWLQIEKVATSVTLAAYLRALKVLNLDFKVIQQPQTDKNTAAKRYLYNIIEALI